MIKKTSSWILTIALILLVVLAGLLITVRMSLPKLNAYSVEISAYLSKKMQAEVSIGGIQALWVQANPQLILENISFTDLSQKSRIISLAKVQAELDIIASILHLAPIFVHLEVDDLTIKAQQINSRWLTVFSPVDDPSASNREQKTAQGEDNLALNRFLTLLSKQSKVKFNNAQLILKPENRPSRVIGPIQFLMQNTSRMHQLSGEAKLKHYGENSIASFAIQATELSDLIIETPYKVYAEFDNLSEQLLAFNLINIGLDVKKLSLSSRIWATLENGLLKDISGKVLLNSLSFENQSYPKLLDSTFDFSFKEAFNKHHLKLLNIKLNTGKSHLNIGQASAVYGQSAGGYLEQIALSRVDLANVSAELLSQPSISDKIKRLVTQLNLKGYINNLVISWSTKNLADFALQADLDQVSVDSYVGAPQLAGVSGLLRMSALQGSVDLNAKNLTMSFPKLFTEQWQYTTASGKISWDIALSNGKPIKVAVNSQLLSLSRDEMQANGRFSLLIPLDKKLQTELILMIGMQNNKAKDLLNYIPVNIVGTNLSKWIKSAVLAGKVEEAGLVLRTGFRKNIPFSSKPSVQLYLDLTAAKVNFDNKWPNFSADNGQVIIADGHVSVSADSGLIAGNQVTNLSVIKHPAKPAIEVKLELSGDLKKLFSKLQQKPAIKYFPEAVRDWQLSGKHQSVLQLQIPLGSASAPSQGQKKSAVKSTVATVMVASQVEQASLFDDNLQLRFNNINGELSYSSAQGLNSQSLNLSSFGYPAKVSIVSSGAAKQLKTSIYFQGGINVQNLEKILATDFLSPVSGNTKFDARLDLCPSNPSCNQLVINSQLQGIAIDLPAPWGKSKKSLRKLQVIANPGAATALTWRYNYANIIRGVTLLPVKKANNILANAATSIVFGGAKPVLAKSSGVHIGGALSGIDLDKVLAFFTAKKTSKGSGISTQLAANGAVSAIKKVEFKLHNVTFYKTKINNSWLKFTRNSRQWSGSFNTEIASGRAIIPHDKNLISSVKLDELVINTTKNQGVNDQKTSKKIASAKLNTSQWPKVNLSINKLLLNSLNIGRWSANLAPTKQGYKASDIKGRIATSKVNAEIVWAKEQRDIKTYLTLTAIGGDFGVVLKQLGYAKVLENKSGKIESQLSWKGYPWEFKQANLNGRVKFKLNSGRIIEAGTSANFLRIFGLLNLNSVIKRLQLDFSDLVESGVAFDAVSGKYYLQNGLATSQEPLKLQGSSATVEMTGTIDFARKTLDQKMLVAIPLSGNAPIAALLLATPQVAGIAFVIDKLFGKKIAKLTALRYAVTGSWLEPNIAPVKSTRGAKTGSNKQK
ncbi:MAG: hypothetical protein OFPII_10730 [Osedax symbiont Rs1]|nr:MAG: hypothetical protein OFPII_10730 [Osedax symbiont Rs1]